MIDAERRKKLGNEFQLATPRSEDLLTSNTFGRLKYLPWSAFIRSFSCIDWKIDNHPIPNEADWVNFDFWPHMGRDEIDLLITTDKALIGVEIKFNSPLSGKDGEDHQLLRYARVIDIYAKRQGKTAFLIYLTAHSRCPEKDLLPMPYFPPSVSVGWASWSAWAEGLKSWIGETNMNRDSIIVADILEILDLRGLLAFAGFKSDICLEFKSDSSWFNYEDENLHYWPTPEGNGTGPVWNFNTYRTRLARN